MRKSTVLILFLAICLGAIAGSKVIVNPTYEVKSSGINNVIKIELSDTETRLTIHSTFVPYWWVSFTKAEHFIRDCGTKKIYELKGIEGDTLDKQIWMKASGDSTFVLLYPPLDQTVRKIDFGNEVFGISLDEKNAGKSPNSTVPPQVTKWIDQELAKAKRKEPVDLNSPMFFSHSTARLIGYIKGYDIRLGFTTGLVYSSNELTREDYPTVVKIYPDGRFEAEWPFEHPKYSYVVLNDRVIPFYLEPGQTLAMILDWEEFLIADRRRNIRYQFEHVIYQGSLAKVNTELAGFKPEEFNYEDFEKKKLSILPVDYKQEQILVQQASIQKVEDYIISNNISTKADKILRSKVLIENANHLFDFVMNRDYYLRQDTANKILKRPVPIAYYDFLKEMPLNDNCLLVSGEFSTFVNRFEYCEPLMRLNRSNIIKPTKPSKDYITFLTEAGVEISAEDKALASLMEKEKRTKDEDSILNSKNDQIDALNKKYETQQKAYFEKYVKPLQKTGMANYYKENWHAKDSVLHDVLGLENSLVYEISKVRSLKYIFESSSKEAAAGFWDELKKGITNPYLLETGDQLLKKSFPDQKIVAYKLPKGTATDVFRKITDPFKGKIVFVDFWATTCGPCVAEIKRMKPIREKHKDNKDFVFIFITDERSSPKDDYDKFVKEQELKNIYRLSKDDYNYLRQLFKFNGIPHYTVIDKAGNVLNNNFPMYNFESELKGILSDK
jgi:thiol-disulfide isomerase/thioredoxin